MMHSSQRVGATRPLNKPKTAGARRMPRDLRQVLTKEHTIQTSVHSSIDQSQQVNSMVSKARRRLGPYKYNVLPE